MSSNTPGAPDGPTPDRRGRVPRRRAAVRWSQGRRTGLVVAGHGRGRRGSRCGCLRGGAVHERGTGAGDRRAARRVGVRRARPRPRRRPEDRGGPDAPQVPGDPRRARPRRRRGPAPLCSTKRSRPRTRARTSTSATTSSRGSATSSRSRRMPGDDEPVLAFVRAGQGPGAGHRGASRRSPTARTRTCRAPRSSTSSWWWRRPTTSPTTSWPTPRRAPSPTTRTSVGGSTRPVAPASSRPTSPRTRRSTSARRWGSRPPTTWAG